MFRAVLTFNLSMQRNDASGSKPRAPTKPKSLLRKFKSLVCLKPSDDSLVDGDASTTSETMRRRTEALRATGLLPQSRIYGQQPYRDDACMPSAPPPLPEKNAPVIADEKDLITLGEVSSKRHVPQNFD